MGIFGANLEAQGEGNQRGGRNARALARLFEFEEFEEDFENYLDTLQPEGWRRI